MKKYVNVVVTDADGNKEMREKAVVVSLQDRGDQNAISLSFVNVGGVDFVMIMCALLKLVDDFDLWDAVLQMASEVDTHFTGLEKANE